MNGHIPFNCWYFHLSTFELKYHFYTSILQYAYLFVQGEDPKRNIFFCMDIDLTLFSHMVYTWLIFKVMRGCQIAKYASSSLIFFFFFFFFFKYISTIFIYFYLINSGRKVIRSLFFFFVLPAIYWMFTTESWKTIVFTKEILCINGFLETNLLFFV